VEGRALVRPKKLKKCMKLNWNFQRGSGVLEKNNFCVSSMDIFGDDKIGRHQKKQKKKV